MSSDTHLLNALIDALGTTRPELRKNLQTKEQLLDLIRNRLARSRES
ncbi:hypothetical protein [Rhizobium sp. YTU87027]